ncbi:GNAT family N-acetyltransferase [Oceanobacillus sp. FSL W7-1293]|uniref:GNAT family N-acetyltransferase n=1 Tax=Oceanobacillus sp. FSL W7-1293 TaxID=2921699 RepID=UPI0030D5BAC1
MNALIKKVFEQVKTENLILRKPSEADAYAVLEIEGDPKTNTYRPSGPMKNIEEALEKIELWNKDWITHGYGYWMISERKGSDVIGIGGVRNINWQGREVLNLYYRFSPKVWGRGYAAEVARYSVYLAREHLSELPIISRVRPSNIPSLRVAEKSGLVRHLSLDSAEHIVFTSGWE